MSGFFMNTFSRGTVTSRSSSVRTRTSLSFTVMISPAIHSKCESGIQTPVPSPNILVPLETKMLYFQNEKRKCSLCSIVLAEGIESYRCSECSNLFLCMKCYSFEAESKSVHYDSAPMPHHMTIVSKSDFEYYQTIKSDTIYQSFVNVFNCYSDRRCIGMKSKNEDHRSNGFDWITYQQLYDRSVALGSAIKPYIEHGSKVAVILNNIPHWYYVDFACLFYGYTLVPLSQQINVEQLIAILENSEPSLLIVSKEIFNRLFDAIKDNKQLKMIIHIEDEYDQEQRETLSPSINFKLYSELINGSTNEIEHSPLKDGILTITYTSGSTGPPKGMARKDAECVSNIINSISRDVSIQMGYLSISNSQRTLDLKTMIVGGRIGIHTSLEVEEFLKELAIFRPTVFWCNPGFYNYFNLKYQKRKIDIQEENPQLSDQECDELAINEIGSIFGDRIKTVVSGSSLLPTETFNFMKKCWGEDKAFNFFGTTETTFISKNDIIYPDVSYQIIPIPGVGEDKSYPVGELLVKSPRTIKQYYNNEEATRNSFRDGWYVTGDVVEEYEPRKIRIISRLKNFFKSIHGRFIYPETIESNFYQSTMIKDIFIYGDPFHAHLVAIIIPSIDIINKYINETTPHINIDDCDDLKSDVFKEIQLISKQKNVVPWGIPQSIYLDSIDWTVENKFLTYTLKYNRSFIANYYIQPIAQMFDKLKSNQTIYFSRIVIRFTLSEVIEFEFIKMVNYTGIYFYYQFNWNITATDCVDIKVDGVLDCLVDENGFQTITKLIIVYPITVDRGEPPAIDKLIFPNMQWFSLIGAQHKNASYSLFGLLDNIENVNLTQISVNSIYLVSVPTFPSKLKLNTLVLSNVQMYSDLNLNPIFAGVSATLSLENIGFSFNFKMLSDSSTMKTKSSLVNITIKDISNRPQIFFESSSLNILDIDNAMVVLGVLPKIRDFKASNCAFSTSDFSVFPSLTKINFNNISTPIENASGLVNVVIQNSPVPIVPPESWFSNTFTLKLNNTNSGGKLQEFKSFDSVSISIYGTQNIKTELYDSFCRFNLDIPSTTLVGNIADCIYCYWSEINSTFPPNTPVPPINYKCNISLDSYKYVIPKSRLLLLNGTNLGWGLNRSPATYPVTTEYGTTNLTFSTIQNYTFQIYWGLELSVYLIQSENINDNNVLIKAFGKFNLKAPLAIKATSFGNSNCQITYNTTTQLNCIIPNQNSTNPILINLDDTVTTINYYSSSTLLISGVHFKINNQDVEISANFGPNPYNVSAIISSFPCQQTFLNSSVLSCRLPSRLVENVNYSLLVYANGYNQTILVFIKPKEDCGSQSNCNGHGSCFDGKCRCNDGYGGYYCESQLSPGVIILPNNTIPSPTVIVKDGMNFTFNIIAIQEIDELSSVVRELKTNKWIHSTTGNETFSITTYSLQSTTPEVDQINATIEYSKNSRLINFAGQSTLYPENSLKLMVTINNWSYKDRLNRLRLLMESISSINDNDDGCSELDISVNNGTEVNFLRMTINDVSFYGRFLPYALSDDKPVFIQNQVVNQTKDSADLYPQELSSLRWLITQYQLNWNLAATDCAGISNPGTLNCGVDQSGFQTINTLTISTSIAVDHGEPPVIDKLIFPNLQTFLLSGAQHKNASYSLLGLLDNIENVNLNLMSVQSLNLVSVPTFPSKLKLNTFTMRNVTMYSDLNMDPIFAGINTSLGFQKITFTSTFKMLSDLSTMTRKSTLTNLFETNGMLNITNSYFSAIDTLTIKDISNTPVILLESSTLYNIDIDNAMVVLGNLPIIRNIKAKNCAFSTSDFSVLPSLYEVNFDNISTPIEKASGLVIVVITNSPVPIVPSESWFSNSSFMLKLNNTNSSGKLPDFKSYEDVSISIYGTQNIKTELYDSFCRFNLDIPSPTLVGNIADCFYCYWSEMKSKLPSNTPNPPNDFKCNISLDSYKYVIPKAGRV
ncbi:hypothetical protein PPL_11976 [Heterostelium album PN500]|uniref:Uncharacterized protein n=1 Tax=Heterostelium pallidum (strain ATCC 26659 / Pp 5 / PN500) TaxID=670386 RepID=D3BV04_HETP5|nr:hypothetical protein PPL_11976 [Heterostelium album PN500]EFA74942.1 hypothetical protein PPL_11976 [Heterostelium album PN500]|eukprot:XP_020427076.1 hypothetical protein PPL_11976 [Heterostelium album PN500]